MVIKEYPAITKGGNTLLTQSNDCNVATEYCRQMGHRGNTCLSFFINKEKLLSKYTKERDESASVCWSVQFTMDDLLTLVLTYTDMTMTFKEKMLWGNRLQEIFLKDELENETESETFL
jgi:hypothetical protein